VNGVKVGVTIKRNGATLYALDTRRVKRQWRLLKRQFPKQMEECETFLHNTPLVRLPGKVKKLKGQLTGIMQYEVTSKHRVWYVVNQDTETVEVIYAGAHPKATD